MTLEESWNTRQRRSMAGSKLFLIVVALIGIMLWNMPSTVSTFAGTHAFYNVTKTDCAKCHSDILTQISESGRINELHSNNSSNSDGCRTCHTISQTMNSSEEYHAAFRPNCSDCHQNVSTYIRGVKESHSTLVAWANNSDTNSGINEACIMCHTKTAQTIEIRNRVVFAFESDSIVANGTTEFNGSYFVIVPSSYTSGMHNYRDNVSCVMCHAKIQDILNQNIDPYQEHRIFGCTGCHRGSGMQVGMTNETPIDYHASKIKYCSDCHGSVSFPRDCNRCHDSHGGLKI
jgi:hypothetical protein